MLNTVCTEFSFGIHRNYAISISTNYHRISENACKCNGRFDAAESEYMHTVIVVEKSAYSVMYTLALKRVGSLYLNDNHKSAGA